MPPFLIPIFIVGIITDFSELSKELPYGSSRYFMISLIFWAMLEASK